MLQQSFDDQTVQTDVQRDPLVIQRLAAAVQELDRTESRARPDELAWCRLSVAHCYAELGMHDTAEWYFRQALGSVRHHGFAALAVDALSGLADALTRRADQSADAADRYACLEQARDLAFEAATLASQALRAPELGLALARAAAVLEACGDAVDAQTLRLRADSLPRAADRLAA